MPQIIEGNLIAQGKRFGLIAGRFNNFMTDRLVEGSVDTLIRHGAKDENITVVKVPGCFEIPMVAKKMAFSGNYDAVICLGTLIRGATPHFDLIAAETTKGIAAISMESGIPVTFGVITSDSVEHAIERAGCKAGNKGVEATLAAIEMVNLYSFL